METTASIAQPETFLVCRTAQDTELRGVLVRLGRYDVVFELSQSTLSLRTSEVLPEVQVFLGNRLAYSGKAVLTSLVDTGTVLMCQAALDEGGFDVSFFSVTRSPDPDFSEFLQIWQKFYRVLPEFKVVVADIQTFLNEMRLWLDRVELQIGSVPAADRPRLEHERGRKIAQATTPVLTRMFERFEEVSSRVEPEHRPAHGAFARQMLHGLLLCSPFLCRTFQKPLGYAGDYEMVNMIMREPLEGRSLFAKIVNAWFIAQPPAEAHRNRIDYLVNLLNATTAQSIHAGRSARFLSLGCGPAQEVQRFLETSDFSDQAQFVLLDFSQETLERTGSRLEEIKRKNGRRTMIQLVNKSVNAVLKEAAKGKARQPDDHYDVVYCAGLFDYLSDVACRRLCSALYDLVAPGGMLVVTNVDPSNPRQPTMDFIMEWHLIYRDARQLAATRPEQAGDDSYVIKSDLTGVNVFMEVRKPEHA